MKISSEQYQAALRVVMDYRDQLRAELDEIVTEVQEAEERHAPEKHITLGELVSNMQCSVRLHNVIYNNQEALGISTPLFKRTKLNVGDLEGVSIRKLHSCRNAGILTVKEFKELCAIYGVKWSP